MPNTPDKPATADDILEGRTTTPPPEANLDHVRKAWLSLMSGQGLKGKRRNRAAYHFMAGVHYGLFGCSEADKTLVGSLMVISMTAGAKVLDPAPDPAAD